MILASGSPRRKELLSLIIEDFQVIKAEVDEKKIVDNYFNENPRNFKNILSLSKKIAEAKALKVGARIKDDIVIGADTMVVLGDIILGKPKDKKEAKEYLMTLAGKKHQVLTSISLYMQGNLETFTSISNVNFYNKSKLMEKLIDEYVESGQALDKAGAYGIQDEGALFIESIEGDFYSIMGLPVSQLNAILWRIENEK